MKMRHNIAAAAFVLLAVGTTAIHADDLMQVYTQALHNDPTFKAAESTWWSAKQNLPIAISAYLPQIDLTDTLTKEYSWALPLTGAAQGSFHQNIWTVSATQAIFDVNAWSNIKKNNAAVKSALATYMASAQDLMARTAKAYFGVLNAYDKLRFTVANKNAVKRQLTTAQQKFKVGLIAITSVYDAQSNYDQAQADEIADRNQLYNALESLRAITGQHYLSLQGIVDQVPLVTPSPTNIDRWVSTAVQQNYGLKAKNFDAIEKHDAIDQATSGYLPTIDATTSYSRTNNSGYQQSLPANNVRTEAADFGLSLDWKPFSGGATFFGTKQARYDYLTALNQLDLEHRSVVSNTRQAYLGVLSGIGQVEADRQAIISAENALKATQAGYLVGTRTMVNVLSDLTTLYKNEDDYMDDQYAYINNVIALKEQAGTLSVDDLKQISGWLKKKIMFPLPRNFYGNVSGVSDAKYHKANKEMSKTTVHVAGLGGVTSDLNDSKLKQRTKLSQSRVKRTRVNAPHSTLTAKKLSTSRHTKPAATSSLQPTALSTKTTVKPAKVRLAKPMKTTQVASANKVPLVTPSPKRVNRPYAIQFYSAEDKHSAENFVKNAPLQSLRVVYSSGLYRVVYGQFTSRSDASLAFNKIHAQKEGAWILRLNKKAHTVMPTHKKVHLANQNTPQVYSDGEGRVSAKHALPAPRHS